MCLLATSEFSHEAVKKHQDTVITALKVCIINFRLPHSAICSNDDKCAIYIAQNCADIEDCNKHLTQNLS